MIETYLLYNFILIASTFFVYLYEKSEDPVLAKLMLYISFLIIFIPAALRYNIGTDYWSYNLIFNDIKTDKPNNIEFGYYWLNQFIISLNLSVEWLFSIVALIIYGLAYASYPKKNTTIYHFLFITIFYLTTFTALRSAITFSISLIALSGYINKKRLLPFCCWVAVGMLFHKSIILITIIPLLDNVMLRALLRKYRLIICLTLILTFIFRFEIISFIFNSSVAQSLGYANYSKGLFAQPKEIGTGLGLLLRVMPLVLVLIYSKSLIQEKKSNSIVLITAAICLITVFLAASIDIFSRLERVFVFGYILAIMVIAQSKRIKYKSIFMCFIISAQIILFEQAINSRSDTCTGARISPYVSIFNKWDDRSLQVPRSVCENN